MSVSLQRSARGIRQLVSKVPEITVSSVGIEPLFEARITFAGCCSMIL